MTPTEVRHTHTRAPDCGWQTCCHLPPTSTLCEPLLPAACGRTSSLRSCTCWATPAPAGPATAPTLWARCRTCGGWMGSRCAQQPGHRQKRRGACMHAPQGCVRHALRRHGGTGAWLQPTLHMLCPQVRPSERIAAAAQLPALEARLRAELQADGIDPDEAAQVRRGMGVRGWAGLMICRLVRRCSICWQRQCTVVGAGELRVSFFLLTPVALPNWHLGCCWANAQLC